MTGQGTGNRHLPTKWLEDLRFELPSFLGVTDARSTWPSLHTNINHLELGMQTFDRYISNARNNRTFVLFLFDFSWISLLSNNKTVYREPFSYSITRHLTRKLEKLTTCLPWIRESRCLYTLVFTWTTRALPQILLFLSLAWCYSKHSVLLIETRFLIYSLRTGQLSMFAKNSACWHPIKIS